MSTDHARVYEWDLVLNDPTGKHRLYDLCSMTLQMTTHNEPPTSGDIVQLRIKSTKFNEPDVLVRVNIDSAYSELCTLQPGMGKWRRIVVGRLCQTVNEDGRSVD